MPSLLKELGEPTRALYTRVAYYYYRRGLTQEEIAKMLHMSRQRVNRILGECLDLGIVEIRIQSDAAHCLELESQLEKGFGLKAARVAGGTVPETLYPELGRHAGQYLAEVVRDGDIIGFSRGKTLSAIAAQIPVLTQKNLVAVQLMGGWNDRHRNAGEDDAVYRFGKRVAAEIVMLYAPVLLQDRKVRDSFIQEPYFQEVYRIIRSCSIAVLGIGQVGLGDLLPGMTDDYFSSYLPKEAVGEVCAHFFDIQGNPVKSEFDGRIIAAEYDDLLRIPLRIGAAGQVKKLPAILGAIRGGYINALVTDTETASALLQQL